MQIGPFTIARTKALPQLRTLSPSGQGWWPWGVIRESFTGAWQANVEIRAETALSYFAVYACLRLISTDIGKLSLRLVEQDDEGIWHDTESSAFSPVLRRPNRFQTINKFIEYWMLSKLMYGNTYVLLERDQRRIVVAMYVLDPSRVTPLVASDGGVYYQLKRDELSGLANETQIFPASEIIHDTYITPFHPLIGLSPIYACGLAATEGLSIQNASKSFFDNGANPGGMLSAPGAIGDDTVRRLLKTVAAKQPGEILIGGDGLKFEKFTMSAIDAQLIDQLKMTAEQVCSAHGVPPYLVDIGPPPPYANFEPLLLKYHSQCIQSLTTNCEKSLDKGLGLTEKINGKQFGTEFDIDDLIWMDTATRVTSANTSIGSGGMSPDEARKKYFGLGSVPGGDTPYMQQQYWPLKQLADRETPQIPASPAPVGDHVQDENDDVEEMEKLLVMVHQKCIAHGLYT